MVVSYRCKIIKLVIHASFLINKACYCFAFTYEFIYECIYILNRLEIEKCIPLLNYTHYQISMALSHTLLLYVLWRDFPFIKYINCSQCQCPLWKFMIRFVIWMATENIVLLQSSNRTSPGLHIILKAHSTHLLSLYGKNDSVLQSGITVI